MLDPNTVYIARLVDQAKATFDTAAESAGSQNLEVLVGTRPTT